jgi:hypothetical protein
LDEEEEKEGVECVNPECDSSHAYRSAKTYSGMDPLSVVH